MSRGKDIEALSSLLGNSAAHVALLPTSDFAQKEVIAYTTDTYEIAADYSFNKDEVAEIRQKSLKRAESEIRKRVLKYGFGTARMDDFINAAKEYIEEFIQGAIES